MDAASSRGERGDTDGSTPVRRLLRAVFAGREDPYAGADLTTSRQIVGLLCGLAALLTLAFLPLSHPTDAIGGFGWVVALLIAVVAMAAVHWLLDMRHRLTFDALLAVSYLGVLVTGVLVWLAGRDSVYQELLILWVGSGVGVHPPRRALPFLGVVLLVSGLPLLYDGWTADAARHFASHGLLWCAVGLALSLLVSATRAQRTELRAGERHARAEAEVAERRVRALHSLAEAARPEMSLDDLLHDLVGLVTDALEAHRGGVFILEPNSSRLMLRASTGGGSAPADLRISLGDGFAGRVAAERRPTVANDVAPDDRRGALFADERSLAGVPLVVDGELLGAVVVGRLTEKRFSDADVQLLQAAAERMALVIDRARLHEQTRHIAATLQRQLLPERLPRIPGVQLAARYLPGGPGTEVGGDWYDVVVHSDGRVGLVMGDVVGRGIGAASLMGQLRTALRAYAIEESSPAAVLERLSAAFHHFDRGQMATLVLITFDPDTSRACLASAGHPPPLAIAPDGTSYFIPHERSLPLGVMPFASYREETVQLEPGSALMLYTDGLVEGRSGIATGLDQLRDAVAGGSLEPESLCDRAIAALLPEGPGGDDVALLVLHEVPFAGQPLDLRLPADPEALTLMRHTLGRWLHASSASESEAYQLTVACGEACANAIEHAYPAGEASFKVEAMRQDGEVVITVRDAGQWREPRGDERGRGIEMMRAFVDDVDIAPKSSGTTVRLRRRLAALH